MLKRRKIKKDYDSSIKFYTLEYNGMSIKIEHDPIFNRIVKNNKEG